VNIVEELFLRANEEAVAVIDQGRTCSYGELNERSAKVALRIREIVEIIGIPRVGLKCSNGIAYVALALGILRSGSCLVPIATELTGAEQEALISTLHLDAVISPEESSDDQVAFSIITLPRGESLELFDALNPAFIRFSSGTTGASKGIVLSHETLIERIETANRGLQITSSDRVLWVLSMSHHFVVSILLYLWNGAAIVLPESYFPGDIIGTANRHHATVFYGAPCHYLFLTSGDAVEALSWPSLRMAVSTTAPLLKDTADRFADAFGILPFQALGVMEVGLPFINNSDDRSRSASVGRPLPGFEVQLRDVTGKAVESGAQGKLFLRGPGMFDAYIDPWQTREHATFPDGWFCTGDIATMDSEGYIFILGRTTTMINVGGMKFFPEEVERCLCSFPGVKEARVIGVPHPAFGSVPIAEMVIEDGKNVLKPSLALHCRKHLARYKVPTDYRFVDSLPKTPSGKIKRI